VTQLDIAQAAGVHNTTVSMALRNLPVIPEATRRRIQALAENMGYRPDPALRALNAYRNGRRPSEKFEAIGYITNCSSKVGWKNIPEYTRYHAGAARKANEHGFYLEHFWLGEAGMSLERLGTVFFHRHINGALFAPDSSEGSLSGFGWNHICAVKIGRDPRTPAFHSAATDHVGALQLALQQGIARGYRRIGFAIPPRWASARTDALSESIATKEGGLLLNQVMPLVRQDFEATLIEGRVAPASSDQIEALRRWMLQEKPDLVVGSSQIVAEILAKIGFSIPKDVGYLELSVAENNSHFSGVRQNCEHVGAVAVEKLVGLMQQNQWGIPNVPTTTLVEPSWIEGSSLPVRS
jgi:DNA-binding LacI/PurR family transcriptional regulator